MRGISVWLAAACLCGNAATILEAQAPSVVYSFNVLGIGEDGDASFVGKSPGNDMLPYTGDDVDLPEGGNLGGTWGFAHMDNNSNRGVDAGEPLFVSVRNDDDDSTLYSAMSRPEYGVIYEGEDWIEYWESSLSGPNGAGPAGNTDLTDFEINDWDGWTDESNAYVYNNLGANQRGLGLAKYRIDYRTSPAEGQDFVFDEIEGWSKTFGFRNTADDPETPFNERGDCRRFYRPRDQIDMRGYLIPVEDLAGLETGSLPSLFGWESVDLATYFRDTIAPRLEDEGLFIFSETGAGLEDLLPITHLYLLQMEIPMDIRNLDGECGGSADPLCANEPDPGACQVQMHAAYWGVPADGSGTYRSSHLLGFNSDLVELVFADVHPWLDRPEDDAELNLWHQDHFWRDDKSHLGKYTFIPPVDPAAETPSWRIIEDPGLQTFDNTPNQILLASGEGSVSAPLSRALSIAETPLMIVADLAVDVTGGAAGDFAFQVIARSGNNVVAYADISDTGTQVHLGGSYDPASGTASNPALSGDGPGAVIGEVDTETFFAEYTRFVLTVTGGGASLRQIEHDDYDVNGFFDLSGFGSELATVSAATSVDFRGGVTDVAISGTARTAVDTFLVFAAPGIGPFVRGDCNQDRSANISDGVMLLNYLFAGGVEPPDCLAACAADGRSTVTIATAVYLFNSLFAGGDPVPPPVGTPAYSQRPEDFAVGCDVYDP